MGGFAQIRSNRAAGWREGDSATPDGLTRMERPVPNAQACALLQMRQALDQSPPVQSQAALQRALDRSADARTSPKRKDKLPIQKKPNAAGLPDRLKAGVEHLSGLAMDDVRVHYNSSKPAAVQAHAYTQGTDIHVAPGQEKHLPHEAWHVVQQKQGRVKPILQMKGVAINDDAGLEREADLFGRQATQAPARDMRQPHRMLAVRNPPAVAVIQGNWFKYLLAAGGLALAGLAAYRHFSARRQPGLMDAETFKARVAKYMEVKAAPSNSDTKEKETDSPSNYLNPIGEQLKAYHALPPSKSQERLKALRQLDRLISTAHGKASEDVGATLVDLHHQSELEHRNIVAELAKTKTSEEKKSSDAKDAQSRENLPVDLTDMTGEQVEEVSRLWRSFLGGKGNLRIKEDESPEFQARMHAAVAKLLQGRSGRELIGQLSDEKGGEQMRVTLGSDFAAQIKGTKLKQESDSQAMPLSGKEEATKDKHFLQEMTSDEKSADPKIVLGNKSYKKGTGTGSYVKIAAGGPKTKVGRDDRRILAPEFITVGHELGHAAAFLKGEAMPEDAPWGQVDQPKERTLWHNPEEYRNITQVENPLRLEHGLAERFYHEGDPNKVRSQRMHGEFQASLNDVLTVAEKSLGKDIFDFMKEHPLCQELEDESNEAKADWTAKATLDNMLGKVGNVQKMAQALAPLKDKGDLNWVSNYYTNRKKVRSNGKFTEKRDAFYKLLGSGGGGISDVCNQLKAIVEQLLADEKNKK